MKFKALIIVSMVVMLGIVTGSAIIISGLNSEIASLTDNVTATQKDLNTVITAYQKLASPKIFKNEEDLITWLNSVKDQSINGYITQARLDGAYMELWVGWVDGKSTISGIDFGENWGTTKSSITGLKYALITVVDGKTFIVDPATKRIISVDLENKNGTWK